jgi:hypothetical protein
LKRYFSIVAVLLSISLIGNVYLFFKNQDTSSELFHHEVSNFMILIQNTITGLKQQDSVLLRQAYSNFQSNPPLAHTSTADGIINKYKQFFKSGLNANQGSHSQEISQLEKIFEILVQLSETEKISEKDVNSSMTEIDTILSDD